MKILKIMILDNWKDVSGKEAYIAKACTTSSMILWSKGNDEFSSWSFDSLPVAPHFGFLGRLLCFASCIWSEANRKVIVSLIH